MGTGVAGGAAAEVSEPGGAGVGTTITRTGTGAATGTSSVPSSTMVCTFKTCKPAVLTVAT